MSDTSEDTPLLRSLRAAVAANPDDVPLRLHLAELLLDRGLPDEAGPHVAAARHRGRISPAGRALMAKAIAQRDSGEPDTQPTGRNMRPVPAAPKERQAGD